MVVTTSVVAGAAGLSALVSWLASTLTARKMLDEQVEEINKGFQQRDQKIQELQEVIQDVVTSGDKAFASLRNGLNIVAEESGKRLKLHDDLIAKMGHQVEDYRGAVQDLRVDVGHLRGLLEGSSQPAGVSG